ncbi:hypothetical protein FDP41_012694 [Naegleria fowleri]|uniref:Uncharacterized protein n=1 Tax=Naegleria fowleri TaxID=5763 RepID=A0A6A5BZQ3_NAEFO|nr:uncharacterized protein FDP41_012694 [Naegleria fowleri]KAF0980906.1 hypothetical protein FDP41_012694 [Naegleria fowleri]
MNNNTSSSALMKKIVILTGASDGLGKSAVQHLVSDHFNSEKQAVHVIMACRSEEKALNAMKEIESHLLNTTSSSSIKGSMEFMKLDLSDLESVKEFAKKFLEKNLPLHSLVCNAGCWSSNDRKTTKQGFEMTYGINHLGHFLLVHLLLDKLKQSAPTRVVIVASSLHKRGNIQELLQDPNCEHSKFSGNQAYNNSKLANVLFAYGLVRRLSQESDSSSSSTIGQSSSTSSSNNNHNTANHLPQCGVSVYALHPGVVNTALLREAIPSWIKPLTSLFFQTPEYAGGCIAYHAMDSKQEGVTGMKFYDQWKEKKSVKDSYQEKYQDELWEMSMTQLTPYLKAD